MIVSFCCEGIKTALAEGIVEFDESMERLYAGNMELIRCPSCGQRNVIKVYNGTGARE